MLYTHRSVLPALACSFLLLGPTSAPATSSSVLAADASAPLPEGRLPAIPDTLGVEHVVLVSVDGLRPDFYLEEGWPTPNLREMAREGVHAKRVLSVFPSVTYPSHTTIVTGALPARHGVPYNTPFEPEGQTGRWYWFADSIRVETLWGAVREAGGRSANVGWPAAIGAPIDRNVPEIWPLEEGADPIAPIREHAAPEGLLSEIEERATGPLTADNFTIDHLARDDHAAEAAAYLLERHRPRLLTVHLIEADHFQHVQGRDGDMVRRAVAVADRAIGRLREAAERAGILESTAFVVTGDHGFSETHTAISPNVWLADAGLRDTTRSRGDWRATFHTSGGSAFLRVRGPDTAATVAEVRRLLGELPDGVRRLFRVVEREELDRLGADPAAPLALAAERGIDFGYGATGPALRPGDGGDHGHLPTTPGMATGFVAWGAGVRPGASAAIMRLQDVGVYVAALLGLELDDAEGVLYPGLLEGGE